jgi:NADH-quinone oxidoreductase subunit K
MNNAYLILGLLLFGLGTAGVLLRKNILLILMSIELMLNAIMLILVAYGAHYGTLDPQLMVFFIMVVAAAEVSVGLALISALFKKHKTLDIDFWRSLNQ